MIMDVRKDYEYGIWGSEEWEMPLERSGMWPNKSWPKGTEHKKELLLTHSKFMNEKGGTEAYYNYSLHTTNYFR